MACLAPISQNFRQEERDRPAAWEAFQRQEERYADDLQSALLRLHDAHVLLQEQFGKFERQENLDAATVRVEQVLKSVESTAAALVTLDRAYAKAPVPFGSFADDDRERLAHKREELAKLTDPNIGSIVKTHTSLARLLDSLRRDRDADLQMAKEASKQLGKLALDIRIFRERFASPITCYAPFSLLEAIELGQRRMTLQLENRYRQKLDGPLRDLLRDANK